MLPRLIFKNVFYIKKVHIEFRKVLKIWYIFCLSSLLPQRTFQLHVSYVLIAFSGNLPLQPSAACHTYWLPSRPYILSAVHSWRRKCVKSFTLLLRRRLHGVIAAMPLMHRVPTIRFRSMGPILSWQFQTAAFAPSGLWPCDLKANTS